MAKQSIFAAPGLKTWLFLLFFWIKVSPTAYANKLTTDAVVGDSKINISIVPTDLNGSALTDIPLNKLIKLKIHVKSLNTKSSKLPKLENFDATMPQHRHGMITKSRITKVSESEYLVEGVKLHMPGEWQLNMQFLEDKISAQVAIPLKL